MLSIHSCNVEIQHQDQGVAVPLENDRPAFHAYGIELGKKDCRQAAKLVEVGWARYSGTYLPQASLNFVKPSSLPAAEIRRARTFGCHSTRVQIDWRRLTAVIAFEACWE